MNADADDLAFIGHQHQLVFLDHGEACHDPAIAVACLDVGNALAAASGAPVITDSRALAIAVFRHRQDIFVGFICDDRHRHHPVLAKKADAPHAGAATPAEDTDGIDGKADGLALAGGEQDIVTVTAGGDPDKLVTLVELHRDLAVPHDVGEIAEAVAPYIAGRGGEHDVKITPAVLVRRHRHHRVDGFAGLDGKQVHHRLAKRLWRGFGEAVAFQLIDHSARCEEKDRRVGVRHKKPGDEILVAGAHAGAALATAALRPVDGQRNPFDIAAMADRHDHVFLLDQVFIILVEHLVGNFGTPVIGKPLTGRRKLFENHLVNPRLRAQNLQIIGNAAGKLAGLLGQLLALHAGQTLKTKVENGAGLRFGQTVMPVDDLVARIVDQPDEGFHLGRGPGPGAQLVARRLGIRGATDQLDDLVDRRQSDHQTGQDMGPFTRLSKKIDRPPGHHFHAEFTKSRDDILEAHLLGPATVHGQHVHREAGLQPRMPKQLVQHHVACRIASHLDDNPHAGAVGFVADIGNALNRLFTDKLADPLKKMRLVHLIGDFGDDDGLAILAVGDDFCPCPHHDRPAARLIGVADAGPAHDHRACREIRSRHDVDQLLDRNLRIADVGLAGRDHLARIVRRDVGGHADGDTVGTIDEKVRIFRRQHCRLKLRLVVILGKIDGFLVDVTKQAFRRPRQPGFGVTHRRRRIAIDRSEIALPVDKRKPHGKILRHPDHGLIDRAVAMRVIVTHHVTDDAGRFARWFRPVVIAFHHCIEDAAMNRLQPVANVGQRPRHDHAHGVVEIGFPHFVGDRNGRIRWMGRGLGRGCGGVVQKGLSRRSGARV